jgi:hypothetical protein
LPFWWSSWIKSIISCPDFVSRLPVGSSANSIGGSLTSALAIATLCCCPPESSLGLCLMRSPGRQPRALLQPCVSFLHPYSLIYQRQLNILHSIQFLQQIEPWNMNPIFLFLISASSLSFISLISFPSSM